MKLGLGCGTDQPSAALITDLKQRDLLKDTRVIWGREFGRTPYGQGRVRPDSYGRDHHGRVFSFWMAGGGVKPGHIHGASGEFGFSVAVGRQFRLTDVHGHVVKEILA